LPVFKGQDMGQADILSYKAASVRGVLRVCTTNKPMRGVCWRLRRNDDAKQMVTEREWDDFVDRYITPRFREGLRVLDARGRWQEPSGKVIREKSRVVIMASMDT